MKEAGSAPRTAPCICRSQPALGSKEGGLSSQQRVGGIKWGERVPPATRIWGQPAVHSIHLGNVTLGGVTRHSGH